MEKKSIATHTQDFSEFFGPKSPNFEEMLFEIVIFRP